MDPRLQQKWMDQVRASSTANFTDPQTYTHQAEGLPDQQVETFFRPYDDGGGGSQAPAPAPDAGLGLGGQGNTLSSLLNSRRSGSRSPNDYHSWRRRQSFDDSQGIDNRTYTNYMMSSAPGGFLSGFLSGY